MFDASGSGMTNAEAAQITMQLMADPKRAAYEQAMQMVYKLNRATQQKLVQYGMVTQQQVNEWNRLSPHYVPLKSIESKFGIRRATVVEYMKDGKRSYFVETVGDGKI